MKRSTKKLFDAIENDEIELLKAGIEEGANVNAADEDGDTPLSLACEYDFIDFVQILEEHGADLNKPNGDDQTPLEIAVWNDREGIAEYLIDKQSKSLDPTLMHKVAAKGQLSLGRLLLEKGVPVDGVADDSGRLPIHWAAQEGHLDFCNWLAEQGADIDVEEEDGRTPFVYAVSEGHLAVVKYLISKGVDIDHACDGGTALTLAFAFNQIEIIELLDQSGVRYDIKSDDDYAIWFAVDYKYRDLIEKYAHKFKGILSEEYLAKLRKRAARRGLLELLDASM